MKCSTGACVRVTYDPKSGHIHVHDSKHPKAAPIEWSEDMWKTSVLERVIEGLLPGGATEPGAEPPADMLHIATWQGGPVKWGPHLFDATEWQTFVHAVEANELSVERLRG